MKKKGLSLIMVFVILFIATIIFDLKGKMVVDFQKTMWIAHSGIQKATKTEQEVPLLLGLICSTVPMVLINTAISLGIFVILGIWGGGHVMKSKIEDTFYQEKEKKIDELVIIPFGDGKRCFIFASSNWPNRYFRLFKKEIIFTDFHKFIAVILIAYLIMSIKDYFNFKGFDSLIEYGRSNIVEDFLLLLITFVASGELGKHIYKRKITFYNKYSDRFKRKQILIPYKGNVTYISIGEEIDINFIEKDRKYVDILEELTE